MLNLYFLLLMRFVFFMKDGDFSSITMWSQLSKIHWDYCRLNICRDIQNMRVVDSIYVLKFQVWIGFIQRKKIQVYPKTSKCAMLAIADSFCQEQNLIEEKYIQMCDLLIKKLSTKSTLKSWQVPHSFSSHNIFSLLCIFGILLIWGKFGRVLTYIIYQ